MRRVALVGLVLAAAAGVATATAPPPDSARVNASGGVSVRLPGGWHLVRGWLSYVTDPIPRLAVANFAVRLSRHTCECGFPNVVDFPRTGAFLFVWEYLGGSRRDLALVPRRPTRFRVTSEEPTLYTCVRTSAGFDFRYEDRVFQVEIYLGPAAGSTARTQVQETLDSMRATPGSVTAAGPAAPAPGWPSPRRPRAG
jgi:hypothetical protein